MNKTTAGISNYKRLEEAYSVFVGSKEAVSVNTGTAALHLSLVALGIGPGDEVIIPDFTMAACAFAVSYTGAKPVFVDCRDDLNIDPRLIENKINSRTKAIMPVHIYGRLCPMDAIMALATKYDLFVVEDACEAQGAVFDSKADVTCWSFYANKIINAEEGGMITTNNKQLADRMRDLKSMAFGLTHNYYHEQIGFNYRMPDSQAALALDSLSKYTENMRKRRQIEALFDFYMNSEVTMPARDTLWVYDFMPVNKAATMRALSRANVPYREFFKPISSFPMYTALQGKNATYYGERGLYLPIDLNYSETDIKRISKLC